MQFRRKFAIVCALLICSAVVTSCIRPQPDVLPDTPEVRALWKANEAQAKLGLVQSAAIALNAVQREDGSPLFSNASTRTVIDIVGSAVRTLQATPDGWIAVTNTALKEVRSRLSAEDQSRISSYLQALELLLEGL